MTNKEKFEQVFGVKFTEDVSMFCNIAPDEACNSYDDCDKCPFSDWWNHKFKESENEN